MPNVTALGLSSIEVAAANAKAADSTWAALGKTYEEYL
jgi:hypothetical protein